MKIVQMLPSLSFGDAVGNDALALDDALRQAGYETAIYAENISPKLENVRARKVRFYEDAPDTVVLYHLSTGTPMTEYVAGLQARVIVIYHNITPVEYFDPVATFAESRKLRGREEARALAKKAVAAFADSDFNRRDLKEIGFTCPIEVLPILIPFEDYARTPDAGTLAGYTGDGLTNIVFVGRVFPNKCHQDLIASFTYYQRHFNEKSRLFLVGSFDESGPYFRDLQEYVHRLGPANVIFTNHISFEKILAYYHLADLFLCLSEHEGFCVPLVEAMYFGKPIVAYDSSAVGETLGGSGILLPEKNPKVVASAMDLVLTRPDLKEALVEGEKARLRDFDNAVIRDQFLGYLKKYLG